MAQGLGESGAARMQVDGGGGGKHRQVQPRQQAACWCTASGAPNLQLSPTFHPASTVHDSAVLTLPAGQVGGEAGHAVR